MADRAKDGDQAKDGELTDIDWGKIHKMAWCDKEFRHLLETDPTAAIRKYASEYGLKITKMVKLRPPPSDVPPEFWEDVNPFPPSCC